MQGYTVCIVVQFDIITYLNLCHYLPWKYVFCDIHV